MKIKNKAIVLGCHVGGLGVIRALGVNNIHSIALTYDNFDFAFTSKYVIDKIEVPHPRREENNFIDFLLQNGEKWKGLLILETDDHSAECISKNRHELQKYYKIVTPQWEILKQFVEKKEAHKLALESGVPHPANYLPHSLEELSEIKDKLDYPTLIKPVHGHVFKSIFNEKNFEVHNEEELIKKFKLCLDAKQEVMIQEIIPGSESNLYKLQAYINSKGEMVGKFFWNKIRQHPPIYGVGRVGVSSERNPEVEELTNKLIHHAKYTGYCSAEFKKDLKDGQLKLMEVNIRMPRNIWLAVSSGVNYPYLIYSDLVENRQIEIKDYHKNLYWIEIGTDLYNAVFQRKKENFTFKEYLKPYIAKRKAFAVFSLKDLRPFLYQIKELFRRGFASVRYY
jgi:predicted ATP-grasp superfamily ATP-dependent carboligase